MDENRVLQLEKYWPYQVAVLADLVGRHTMQVAQQHGGLNLSQWRVLAAVAQHPGCSAKDVVRLTPMDKGIVSRAVSGLIKQDVLRRDVSSADRRLTHLYLTAFGQKTYGAIAQALTKEVANATTHLGQDADLLKSLTRYIEAMRLRAEKDA